MLDRVIFRSIPDNSVRLIELQQGNLHAMEFPNPDDLQQIRDDATLELLSQPGMSIGYLAMNMDKPPFDNHKVRLAINHAINKPVIIEHLYQGLGIPAKNRFRRRFGVMTIRLKLTLTILNSRNNFLLKPGTLMDLRRHSGHYPCRGRIFLMDAPLLRYCSRNSETSVFRQKIVTYDWGTYLEKTKNGEHDIAMLGWFADLGGPR